MILLSTHRKGTLSISEQLRLVHILTYHAVTYVYGLCVGLLHAYNE